MRLACKNGHASLVVKLDVYVRVDEIGAVAVQRDLYAGIVACDQDDAEDEPCAIGEDVARIAVERTMRAVDDALLDVVMPGKMVA